MTPARYRRQLAAMWLIVAVSLGLVAVGDWAGQSHLIPTTQEP